MKEFIRYDGRYRLERMGNGWVRIRGWTYEPGEWSGWVVHAVDDLLRCYGIEPDNLEGAEWAGSDGWGGVKGLLWGCWEALHGERVPGLRVVRRGDIVR